MGDGASPMSVTLSPHSRSPSMKAFWRAGLVRRMSRPTAMCFESYLRMRWVAVALPIRWTDSSVRSGSGSFGSSSRWELSAIPRIS